MQDPYNSQQSPYQSDPSGQSMTPPPPPGQPYQSAPSYPTYPPQQHTTYPPQPPSAYPVQPSQPYPTTAPQAYPATTPAPYPPYGVPAPQRKSNTTLLAVIGVIVAILIVGVGVIVAVSRSSGNSNNNQPTTQVTTPAGQPTQGSQPTTLPTNSASSNHKVGDKVSLDGYTIVVNSVKTTPGGQYDTPEHAGDIYLEVDVSITNQTGKAQSFDSMESFTLKDSTGQQYDQTILLDAPSSPDGTIQNGGTLRGTMPYEIAPSMKSFELDFTPDPFGNTDQATWNLSVS